MNERFSQGLERTRRDMGTYNFLRISLVPTIGEERVVMRGCMSGIPEATVIILTTAERGPMIPGTSSDTRNAGIPRRGCS
jgi:hypothetical protein